MWLEMSYQHYQTKSQNKRLEDEFENIRIFDSLFDIDNVNDIEYEADFEWFDNEGDEWINTELR